MMKNIVSLVLILMTFNLLAQKTGFDCGTSLPMEKVILHTDREAYLVGETIWFTAYDLVEGQLNATVSKILLIELFDDQGRSLVQQKYPLEEGMAFGGMDIPEEVGTGHFFVRAYTQYLRNFPPMAYANNVIVVINPLSDAAKIQPIDKKDEATSDIVDALVAPTWKPVQVSVDRSEYAPREKVAITLTGQAPQASHLSISVRPLGTGMNPEVLPDYLMANPWLAPSYLDQWPLSAALEKQWKQDIKGVALPDQIDSLAFLPDTRGISLSGIVRDKNTKTPVPGVICLASVVGQQPQIHLNTTREDGAFVFAFDQLQGEQDLCVGMSNRDAGEVEILINNDFSTDFSALQAVPLTFDSAQHRLFEKMYLNEQLQQQFSWAKTVSSTPPAEDLIPSTNLGTADEFFEIADFIDLPTLEDVFREVIPFVKVRGKVGARTLSIWDKQIELYNDNPVVLLDNVPIYDIDELLKLNPKNIQRIGVIYANYLLGDYLFGGMLSITTSTDNFAGYQWPGESVFFSFTTISSGKTFQYPDYSVPGTRESRKPDFRTTLYWNPQVALTQEEKTINFFTSDFTGDFEVIVRGVSEDGSLLYGKTTFSVHR